MKTQIKHIQGPWHLHDREDNIVCGPMGISIADCNAKHRSKEENLANAKRIVAAPELLEACKMFVKYLDDGVLVRDITKDAESGWTMKMMSFVRDMKKAQEAITKAEGEV